MKQFKHYDFYQNYTGDKCDLRTFKVRTWRWIKPEDAIYPCRLNELTRGYTMDDKIAEEKRLKSQIAKLKQQLYKNQELKELRRQLKVVRSTILNIKKSKRQ